MKTIAYVLVCLSISLSMISCVTIRQGEVGVKRKLGRINPEPIREGVTGYNPFNSTIFRIPTRTVNLEVQLPLPSKEGLTINSQISILYRVLPDSAPVLVEKIGMNYEEALILPVFRSAVADVSARFYAKDMHSGERAIIEREIAETMNKILLERGLRIDNVLMKSIQLPADLTRAIEQKLRAEQEAQQMVFIKQREQADAERRIIQAKGEKDAQIIAAEAEKRTTEIQAEGRANALTIAAKAQALQAKGRADALIIEAEAEAEANAKLQASLSEEVIRMRAIEAFIQVARSSNSKIVITGSDTPILGLPAEILND